MLKSHKWHPHQWIDNLFLHLLDIQSKYVDLKVSIGFDRPAVANEELRGRAVAKVEVWLSLRVAAIQQQWLKRLDWERLSPTLSVEFELFQHCTVRDTWVTTFREHLLGVIGVRR